MFISLVLASTDYADGAGPRSARLTDARYHGDAGMASPLLHRRNLDVAVGAAAFRRRIVHTGHSPLRFLAMFA